MSESHTSRPVNEPPLADLSALWRSGGPAPLDHEALSRKVRWRSVRMRLLVISEVLLTLGAYWLVWWALPRSPGPLWISWAVFILAFATTALAAELWIRAGTWRAVGDGPRALVGLEMRRARASIALVRLCYLMVWACFAFLLVWGFFDLRGVVESGATVWSRAIAYGAAVVYGLAFLVGGRWYARRKRRELHGWEAVYTQLESGEGGRRGHGDTSAQTPAG